MKRNIGILLILLVCAKAHAQELVVNAFIPPGVLTNKEQLWNVIISNPTHTPRSCQLSLSVLNKADGSKMLTAITNNILIPGGTRQMQVADVMPVVYNALNENVSLSGNGLLPVGLYMICYEVIGNKGESYGSTCIDVQVEVLAPPQLIFPVNKSELKEQELSFSWVPPMPMTLVRNCTYEYKIVKVNSDQTAGDAIRDNVPVYNTTRLSNTMLNYPASATALEKQQLYAWQIIARTSSADINSDVWTFTITDTEQPKTAKSSGIAYTKLAHENVSYSVVAQTLRFSWYNESMDSLFQISVLDVTAADHVPLKIKAMPVFVPGMNQIDLNLPEAGKFIRNHMYEFSLLDKQGRAWKMLFEYKGKKK